MKKFQFSLLLGWIISIRADIGEPQDPPMSIVLHAVSLFFFAQAAWFAYKDK